MWGGLGVADRCVRPPMSSVLFVALLCDAFFAVPGVLCSLLLCLLRVVDAALLCFALHPRLA